MKNLVRLISFLLVIVMISGCSRRNNDDSTGDRFKVYIGDTTDLSSEYVIRDKPIFTDNDIEYYDWDNQKIVFKDEYLEQLDVPFVEEKRYIGGSRLLGTSSIDKFYVYVDDELIYDGCFAQSMLSSFLPQGAIISDINDGVYIKFVNLCGDQLDKRYDERILKLLEKKALIKE
ncbi:MAG: hypothetical protein CVU84_02065 [Firmicutes bacterium HGW-Firmicutes-1]|nr:MAG: hypothetical protein CVU84_02065 [Firmicutes bacterium HGW-Firmicutes-1]